MSSDSSYLSQWIEDVSQQSSRYGLVLALVGYAHEPLRTGFTAVSEHVMTVSDYLAETLDDGPIRVVLTDVESMCSDSAGNGLGLLRERVSSDLDRSINVVLVSRYPRIRYPAVPGSSLLEDAKLLLPPLATPVSRERGDPAAVLPIHAERPNQDLWQTLACILEELGDEVLASLDHALFESMCTRDEALTLPTPRVLEALCGAGLVQLQGEDFKWTMPTRHGELREALADALAAMTHTPRSMNETFGAVWSLERTLRRAIRARARTLWGATWRQEALNGDLPTKTLERAKGDAYAAAKSIRELRDPLEWLSLGELLELRRRPEFGGLGVEEIVWTKLAMEVLPVRNRLSHMRLLQDGDLSTVRKWQRILDRKLHR
ncbi:hypothetical protein [Knoellia sp. p5-6-4]|uniref:hypothetical protein n=1 Tax=unclassified Knoellia TaxID=2618719 RepID=UPI0023DA1D92|nr:hypothetical protein [Knoellia sp. p5-6-4]MDF2146766.1 hypothetical protein [Knoellia sp. p5-6-4]